MSRPVVSEFRPAVCLDCVSANDRGAFVGNLVHARELALALDRRDDLRLVLLVDKFTRGMFEDLRVRARLQDCVPRHKNKVTDQVEISRILSRLKPDLYHKPNGQLPLTGIPCRSIVSIADLNFKRLPFSLLARLYKEIGYRRSVRVAREVICISEFTQSEVHRFYPAARAKTTVILHGTNKLQPPDDSVARAIPVPYFLTFGQHRHKNVVVGIEALARLRREERQVPGLVVVGSGRHIDEHLRPRAVELGLGDVVTFLGRISDAALHGLYRSAQGLLFMSHYEGFGLPLLEAMQSGCPVVASDVCSHPEVAGGAATLLPPNDDGALAAEMTRLLLDHDHRQAMRTRGLRRAGEFSWEKAAEETVAVYNRHVPAKGLPA